jgi:hypothetical protein
MHRYTVRLRTFNVYNSTDLLLSLSIRKEEEAKRFFHFSSAQLFISVPIHLTPHLTLNALSGHSFLILETAVAPPRLINTLIFSLLSSATLN